MIINKIVPSVLLVGLYVKRRRKVACCAKTLDFYQASSDNGGKQVASIRLLVCVND